MSNQIEIEVPSEYQKSRLDLALVELIQVDPTPSRSQISKWIDSGAVTVNGELVLKPAFIVEQKDIISVIIPDAQPLEIIPDSSIPLSIVFEDEDLLIINKQAGLVVHPGAGNWKGTLVNALAAYLGEGFFKDSLRPGIVHRLDKDTSGLMVVAKSNLALQSLAEQFLPPRKISREYLAVSVNKFPNESGVIEYPISRHLTDRKRMAVVKNGKSAITHWQVIEHFNNKTCLVKLRLETGRTHQIRVHLEYMNSPIIGDKAYGPVIGGLPNKIRKICQDFPRQALHASRLVLIHPKTLKSMEFNCDLSEDIDQLIFRLRQTD